MVQAPRLYEIISRMDDNEFDHFDKTATHQKMSFMDIVGNLQDKAYKDKLTGVHNRRAFDEDVKEGKKFNFSFISIDLDRFKLVNDTYGHDAGDQVLQDACKLINGVLRRKNDTILYRLGGEELAVVLPNTGEEGAEIVAENIRETLEKNLKIEGADKYVTASFGVGHYGGGQESLDTFLKDVDGALYQAKNSGRNKVVSVDEVKRN